MFLEFPDSVIQHLWLSYKQGSDLIDLRAATEMQDVVGLTFEIYFYLLVFRCLNKKTSDNRSLLEEDSGKQRLKEFESASTRPVGFTTGKNGRLGSGSASLLSLSFPSVRLLVAFILRLISRSAAPFGSGPGFLVVEVGQILKIGILGLRLFCG